jgi:hypothetical protein
MSLTKATNSMIVGAYINILDYGADPTGVADSTAAIAAAQAAACSGAIGLDGVTVIAQNAVYFPAGTYKVTGLTYVGAPWVGAGAAATFVKLYASTGACVNAVGTTSARKILQISNMTFDGSNCTGTTAIGLQLGYNQRSLAALQSVRIDNFPGPAIFFAQPTWMMSFYDVYCSFNANDSSSLGSAILFSNTLTEGTVLALDWFNLQLENNGFVSSGLGGGIHINSNAINTCKFYGGTWEGNYGNAEAFFGGALNVYIDGLYLEAEAASVTNGLVFTNASYGSVSNSFIAGEIGMTGTGIRVDNASTVALQQIYSNINWVCDISSEDGSTVSLEGNNATLLFNVVGDSVLNRSAINRVQLTDAPTIAVNAALANSFYVTLFDNRTMGAPTNPSAGQRILFTIIQNGTTAACTLAWNAIYKVTWSNTGNTASKRSLIEFEYDGTNWVQCSLQVPYF